MTSRDYRRFPNDENGDVLWRMAEAGDNLELPREIDFAIIFPTEASAVQFATNLLRAEQKVSFSSYPEHETLPWQVQVHAHMELTYENISAFEARLANDSQSFGGVNDGWACFSQ